MRLIGTLEGRVKAELFTGYLIAQKISAQVEAQNGATDVWELWIRDEDQVGAAKYELEQFRLATDLSKYEQSKRIATELVKEQQKKSQAAAKQIRRVQFGNGQPPARWWPPRITMSLILISIMISLISNFGKPSNQNTLGLSILEQLSFVGNDQFENSAITSPSQVDPGHDLRRGQVWRAITPIFLHLSPLHLLFNVLMIAQLGRIVERMEGGLKFGFLVLCVALLSNLLQGLTPPEYNGVKLFGSPFFGGLSGVVYGLFGFLWIKTMIRTELGVYLPTGSVILMLAWLVLGFTGLLGPIANLAHWGGLMVGMGLGWIAAKAPVSTQKR